MNQSDILTFIATFLLALIAGAVTFESLFHLGQMISGVA
jgi:hypothetical protein